MDDGSGSLKTEKIDRLIEAAIKEFAKSGYEKASTAQICKSAGVSKGLLFHHFETKKGLYLEVYKRILVDFISVIDKVTYEDCVTYMDTIIKASNVKLKYFMEHSGVYEIVLEANYRPPEELKADLKRVFDEFVKMDNYFSEQIFEKYEFREGIDPNKAWEILTAVVALVERKIMQKFDLGKSSERPLLEEIIDSSDELFEYFDIVFNGITVQGGDTVKRGLARERDNDGKRRYKAI